MKNFIKTRLSFIFLVFLFCSNLYCQNYDEVFFTARELWQQDLKTQAATEFKRYIFLQDYSSKIDVEKFGQSYGYLSLYYEEAEALELALQYQIYKIGLTANDDDYLRQISLVKKLAKKNDCGLETELAIWKFCYLENYSDQVRIAAWKALLSRQIDMDDWESFKINYEQFESLFGDYFSSEQKEVILQTLEKLGKVKLKKKGVAVSLSVIPGLGQLYAGDVKDSLNAFCLNGALMGVSAFSICTGNYFDFALLEFKPTFRFYKGNFYKAKVDVAKQNRKKIEKLKQPLVLLFD